MFSLNDTFDDDVVQAAINIDEDLFLASQLNDVEQCIAEEKLREERRDFELALKLSEELNEQEASFSSDLAVSVHSKSRPNTGVPFCSDVDEDFLLAIQLSATDYHSPSKEKELISFDINDDSDVEEISTNDVNSDYLLAVQLSQSDSPSKSQKPVENHENVIKYSNKELSVVHPSWETIDPNPDIYALFVAFNNRFFWGKLDMVEVKWSPRMTLCAGICSYQKRAGHCIVKLSKPLLQLRPRKDLVETLLHEMIHAYLFVTKNDRDRDGHGPRFHSHMYRINKESGANITVYHNFHDEVKYYKNHEWRCSGLCRDRPPFYGYVRRSMNRPPGPCDNWWSDHKATCNGSFIKTREPEDYRKKKEMAEKKSRAKEKEMKNGIQNYFKIQPSGTTTAGSMLSSTPDKTFGTVRTPLANVAIPTPSTNKKIFTLSDLAKNKRSPTKSPSGSPKKWAPLSGQRNILHFVHK